MVQNSIPPSDPNALRAGSWHLVVVVGAVLALGPGIALAAACPAGPAPEIRVISAMPQPDYHHELTRPQIGARAGHGHMSSDRKHLGLTHIEHGYQVKPTVGFKRMSDGNTCAWLKSVEVTFRVTDFRVDVAAEYRRGTCAYDEILRHENQHVAIYQRAYTAADRDLRAALADAARHERPYQVHASQDQILKMFSDRMVSVVAPVITRHMADARRANAALDTPENYRAEQRRCRDW